VSALEQWRSEVWRGERRPDRPLDVLWDAACRELNDDEFDLEYGAPMRARLAFLRDRGKTYRTPRPAKWERDLAMMTEFDDGD